MKVSKFSVLSFALMASLSVQAFADDNAALNSRDPIVAKVGSQSIRRSDVFDYIRMTSPRLAADPETLTKIFPKMVRDMTTRLATTKKAREQKLDQTVEVKKMKQECELGVLHQAYLFHGLKDSFPEEELKKEYDIYKKDFVVEDQIEAFHILSKSEKNAKDIVARLKTGEEFSKLAKESEDPGSKDKGGELGYLGKNDVPPEFSKALFDLKENEYTDAPIKTDFGFHVIKRGKLRKSEPGAYEKIKADLLPLRLVQKKVMERIQKAREDAKIEEFNIDGSPLSQTPAVLNLGGPSDNTSTSSSTPSASEDKKTAEDTVGAAVGELVGRK